MSRIREHIISGLRAMGGREAPTSAAAVEESGRVMGKALPAPDQPVRTGDRDRDREAEARQARQQQMDSVKREIAARSAEMETAEGRLRSETDAIAALQRTEDATNDLQELETLQNRKRAHEILRGRAERDLAQSQKRLSELNATLKALEAADAIAMENQIVADRIENGTAEAREIIETMSAAFDRLREICCDLRYSHRGCSGANWQRLRGASDNIVTEFRQTILEKKIREINDGRQSRINEFLQRQTY